MKKYSSKNPIQRLSWKILQDQNARHLENVNSLNIIKNQAIELKRLFEKKVIIKEFREI